MGVIFVESTLDCNNTTSIKFTAINISFMCCFFKSDKITNRDLFIGTQNFWIGSWIE
jgi:hypothetical protein